jgi:hypothetical protein
MLLFDLNPEQDMENAVLRIRIPDPVPFDPWSRDPGWVKKSKPGSEMNIPDHNSESLETIFWVKNT